MDPVTNHPTTAAYDGNVIDVEVEQSLSKQALRTSNALAIRKNTDLETKPHEKDVAAKTNDKAGFFKSKVVPIFYEDKKVTPVGYVTGAISITLAVGAFLKLKKEREWSRQRVKVGTTVAPLILNTDSSHLKGLLHV